MTELADNYIAKVLEENKKIQDLEAQIDTAATERGRLIQEAVDKGVKLNEFAIALNVTYPRAYNIMKRGQQ